MDGGRKEEGSLLIRKGFWTKKYNIIAEIQESYYKREGIFVIDFSN